MKNPNIFIVQVLLALTFLISVMAWTAAVSPAFTSTEEVLKVIQK